jgi:hypothetical protein
MSKRNRVYRKIYEAYHGKIPKDDQGNTFDVHHIDGDRDNNDIENLIALSIRDHYELHLSQGDWNACVPLAERLKLSPEEKSRVSSMAAIRRVLDGTHNFQDKEAAKRNANRRVDEGNHHFVGDTNPVFKQLKEGSHPFQKRLDGTSVTSDRMKDGTHPFVGGKIQRETCLRRMSEGIHNIGAINSYTSICPHCDRTIKGKGNEKKHQESCLRKFTALIQNS